MKYLLFLNTPLVEIRNIYMILDCYGWMDCVKKIMLNPPGKTLTILDPSYHSQIAYIDDVNARNNHTNTNRPKKWE